MEKYTRTVKIESSEITARLFGSFDINVRMLEKCFDVKIHNRAGDDSDAVIISGESQDGVNLAADAVKYLKDMARYNETLTEQQVGYVMEMVRDGNREELADLEGGCICITTKGKPIKAKTVGQKRYVEAIEKNTVVFGIGPAGTGKTYLAMAMAVSAFKKKEIEKIILTRPAVEAGEKLGFLPGDLKMKVDPYLRPLYDALNDLMGYETYTKLIEREVIEIAPLAYMRGRTLNNAYIILDEAQNTTREQMKMLLTRTGVNSKVVVNGDTTQLDLPEGKKSGLTDAAHVLKGISGIDFVYLTAADVVRHELVMKIIRAYEKKNRE